jgi:hypothetical protein
MPQDEFDALVARMAEVECKYEADAHNNARAEWGLPTPPNKAYR